MCLLGAIPSRSGSFNFGFFLVGMILQSSLLLTRFPPELWFHSLSDRECVTWVRHTHSPDLQQENARLIYYDGAAQAALPRTQKAGCLHCTGHAFWYQGCVSKTAVTKEERLPLLMRPIVKGVWSHLFLLGASLIPLSQVYIVLAFGLS